MKYLNRSVRNKRCLDHQIVTEKNKKIWVAILRKYNKRLAVVESIFESHDFLLFITRVT